MRFSLGDVNHQRAPRTVDVGTRETVELLRSSNYWNVEVPEVASTHTYTRPHAATDVCTARRLRLILYSILATGIANSLILYRTWVSTLYERASEVSPLSYRPSELDCVPETGNEGGGGD